MKIEQSKAVLLTVILEKLQTEPKSVKEARYLSPLRNEKTASFKVQTEKNVWYNFWEGWRSADIFCGYLKVGF
jgi:hypothetical protein